MRRYWSTLPYILLLTTGPKQSHPSTAYRAYSDCPHDDNSDPDCYLTDYDLDGAPGSDRSTLSSLQILPVEQSDDTSAHRDRE